MTYYDHRKRAGGTIWAYSLNRSSAAAGTGRWHLVRHSSSMSKRPFDADVFVAKYDRAVVIGSLQKRARLNVAEEKKKEEEETLLEACANVPLSSSSFVSHTGSQR